MKQRHAVEGFLKKHNFKKEALKLFVWVLFFAALKYIPVYVKSPSLTP